MSPVDDTTHKETVKALNSRSRSLLRSLERIDDGMCAELARAALLEAAAILTDCAEQCEMMPQRIDESEH